LRADGRTFDATWQHTPDNDTGVLNNFVRIVSITGDRIIIERPELGNYTGTISKDRKQINGRASWADGVWQVNVVGKSLPEQLR
jgi:hypothetical protein